ncbi:ribonuclease HII [Cellulomonas palmilytica]|uniref:ribonuclease HII n=1 Tax=Cellulomonas palmilytica TaxID=2608402 RepID=UPI001F465221|nr:ribonuclease HII [Cellulomonas palmilytica]UJP38669.1 ribonuclease HII [Cellulomonas palmilytica]
MTALDDRSTTAPDRPTGPVRARAPRPGPHLRLERTLLRDGARLVAGMDEVGRGSLAGPVSVGVVVVDAGTRSAPQGVADSKLLTPAARTALLPRLRRWGLSRAVGHASAAEIDEIGIIAALRLAGHRALAAACATTGPVDVVVLDGSHDWLTPPAQRDLFDLDAPVLAAPRVQMKVKADRTCASVAAASVLAKCERDALMVELAAQHPHFRWDENKGYASPDHLAALRELGPCVLHRRSWRLTGPAAQDPAAADAVPLVAGSPRSARLDDDGAARWDDEAVAWGMMST